jgi:hypothetical protein
MFDQYSYFKAIITTKDFPEIKTISRVSGLMGMEEAVENLRTITPLMLLIEDDADGFLDLSHGNLDNGFHTFTIADVVKLADSADRYRALGVCMAAGLKIFKKMIADSENFGDPVYGFDRSRIEYQKVGPLVNNTWGYMYTYTLRNENFKLTK